MIRDTEPPPAGVVIPRASAAGYIALIRGLLKPEPGVTINLSWLERAQLTQLLRTLQTCIQPPEKGNNETEGA